MHKHKTSKFQKISPFNIATVEEVHKARTRWFDRPFHLIIYQYQIKILCITANTSADQKTNKHTNKKQQLHRHATFSRCQTSLQSLERNDSVTQPKHSVLCCLALTTASLVPHRKRGGILILRGRLTE